VPLTGTTAAGDVLVLGIAASAETGYPSVASVSGDSAWTEAAPCHGTYENNASDWLMTDCYYILSATGGAKSVSVTFTGVTKAAMLAWDLEVWEVSCPGCTAALDTSSFVTHANCTACATPALTLSGDADAILEVGNFAQAYSSIAAPYALLDYDAATYNAYAYELNATSAPSENWGQSPAGNMIAAAVAIKFNP
jgi:hypothetical protein